MARIVAQRVGRGLAALAMAAACCVLGVPSASAAGGTWGAAHIPYVDGVVCNEGLVTSPLASWDFGDPSLDFLTTAVTSNGVHDSAQLPTASAPGRTTGSVFAGELGFASSSDIATYAALLSRFGRAETAAAAAALFQQTDPGSVPSCADLSAAERVLHRAQLLAGPYQLTLQARSSPALVGVADSVTVTVTGASGIGVPGVAVAVTSFENVFAHGATQATVRTGADGTATVSVTPPDGTSTVDLSASAQVSVGLESVTAYSGIGTSYAGAVFADPPQTFTATTQVPIDTTAHPQIAIARASSAGVVGASIDLVADVSGMRGHQGQVQLAVTGPIGLDKTALCSKLPAESVPNTSAYLSPAFDFQGDGPVDTGSWTPDKPGCYRIDAQVTTTDATPQASATARSVVLTVLAASSTMTLPHDVVGPGVVKARVVLTNSYSLPGTAMLKLQGPARPAGQDCAALTWSHVPTATTVQVPTRGDKAYALTTSITAAGCYLVTGTVALNVPGGPVAKVPIATNVADAVLYLLRPTVTATADQTWAVSPNVVPTHVSITGTFGQAGTARIRMMRAPSGPLGCRGISYAHAVQDSVGAPVAFTGDGTVALPSGKTPQNGCYSLVPVITMTANAAVQAMGKAGAVGSTVVAGVPVSNILGGLPPRALDSSPIAITLWPVLIGFVLLTAIIGGVVVMIAKDERHGHQHRPLPGLDLLD